MKAIIILYYHLQKCFKERTICILLSLLIGNLFSCTDATTHQGTDKPNVILIVVDDWGWKDAGFMGSQYYETPNLDAFAKEGTVFTNAYASAANCAPSRASMLSGRNTPWHGVYTVSPSARGNEKTRKIIPTPNTPHLTNEVYTLPKMMKNAGYVTGSFGKWHVGDDPTIQGIDKNVGGNGRGNPGRGGYFSPYKIDNIEHGPEGEYLTDRLASEAMNFIEDNQDTSFFLYVPFYTVHTPIMGKEEWIEKYKNKPGVGGHNSPEYAAMVSSMDENIGRILSKLKSLNLYDNSLVILTSDNGGLLRITEQEPLRAGKGSYYEGGIRVPLVMKWKEHISANAINETRITNLDFYPTLQAIVQPERKADTLEGMNLATLFNGEVVPNRDLFFHFPIYLEASRAVKGLRDPLFRTRPGSVIIEGNWKLHHYFEDDDIELYDLSNDVSESQNLAEKNPEVRQRLYKKLDEWRMKTGAAIPKEANPLYDADFELEKMEEKRKSIERN